MQQNTSANRIAYFDWLRVIAMFLIMLLHTASYEWYDADIHSGSWLILNGFKSLTDSAVLLFVLISGALFLTREIPLKKLYGKYILRMVCAFVVWSFIYALISNYMWGIKSVFEVTLASHYHLWFIPMIAGLYICLPVIRLFVKDQKIMRYFLIVTFIIAFVIPEFINLLAQFGNIEISSYLGGQTLSMYASYIQDRVDEAGIGIVSGYAFYFVLGYYLNKTELSKKMRCILYALGIASFFITFALTGADTLAGGVPSDIFHENFNIPVLFEVIAIFVFFRQIIKTDSSRGFGAFMAKLSKYSFGAYLIHALVIEQIDERLGFNAMSINPIIAVPAIAAVCFVISFAISALINKIPFIKRYIV